MPVQNNKRISTIIISEPDTVPLGPATVSCGFDSGLGRGSLCKINNIIASQLLLNYSETVPERTGMQSLTHPESQGCGGRGDMQARGKVLLAEIA